MGTAFFVGIKAASPDMLATAEKYYISYNLMDIRVQSTIGLTDSDLNSLLEVGNIAYGTGVKFVDALVRVNGSIESDIDGTQISTRAYSIDPDKISNYVLGYEDGSYINRPELLSGRYPESVNECLVDASTLSTPQSYKIGNVITLEGGTADSSLNVNSFTIVGVIQSPYYISFERGNTDIGSGKIGTYIIIPEEAFTADYYSEIYLTAEGSDSYAPYSDEYYDYISSVTAAIGDAAQNCINKRVTELRTTLPQKISDAQKKINDAKAELADAQKQKDELEQKIKDSEADLELRKTNYENDYKQAQDSLASNRTEYVAAVENYSKLYDEFEKKVAEYDKNYEMVNKASDAYDELNSKLTSAQNTKNIAASAVATTKTLVDTVESVMQQLAEKQSSSFDAKEIQAIIGVLQTAYPELYAAIPNLTTAGTLALAIDTITPYLDKQKSNLAVEEKKLEQTQATLDGYRKQLNDAEYALTAASTLLASAKKERDKANADLTEYYQKLQSTGINLSTGDLQLAVEKMQAENEIKAAEDKLKEAKTTLASLETTLNDSRQQLDSKLSAVYSELDKAQNTFNNLDSAKWFVYDRSATPGYTGYGQASENIGVLANIFPVFFFLIACLICLTTMGRMVEDDRTLLGTYKALGYEEKNVSAKYIIYAASAGFIGFVLGVGIGIFLFPYAIFKAYSVMYSMPALIYRVPWLYILAAFVISLACTAGTAAAVCRTDLRDAPAKLMRAKAPRPGNRILLEKINFIWRRMSFSHKVMFRNLFRNKGRLIMTVAGIAGCTALLLSSLGMYNSLDAIVKKQYGKNAISKFDFQIVFSESQDSSAPSPEYTAVSSYSKVKSLMPISMKSVTGGSDNSSKEYDVYILVPENTASLTEYVEMNNRKTGTQYIPDDTGVVITEKFARDTDTHIGESIFVRLTDGTQHYMTVSGIVENYTFHYIYITEALYTQTFGEKPEYNYAYGKLSDGVIGNNSDADNIELGKISTDLMNIDGIQAVTYVSDMTASFTEITKALLTVVFVFFFSALVLAFAVLYNLTNINIMERVRELATLKVLGFQDFEVSRYIYRENAVNTGIGIFFGVFLGMGLHYLIITFAEIDTVMFGRSIEWYSYLAAVLISILFAVLVNILMHFKLKKIDMVNSLKSVE